MTSCINICCTIIIFTAGLLPPPGDFISIHDFSSSAIRLQWSPPFTLDITDTDPDISEYIVHVRNINTNQSLEVNTTELQFNFTGLPGENKPNPCHIYTFSVSAVNVVGEGGISDPLQDCFPGGQPVHDGYAYS